MSKSQATSPTTVVWMATRRKGLAYHDIDGRQTTCGRHVGVMSRGAPEHGVTLTRAEAEAIGASPCGKRCYVRDPKHQPRVAPSKDRRTAVSA